MVLLLLAAGDPTGGWGDVLAVYGPFAPFAVVLLFICNVLWKDNKEKDGEIKRLTEATMEKVLPLVIEGTRTLTETVELIKNAREWARSSEEASGLMEELIQSLDLRVPTKHEPPKRR